MSNIIASVSHDKPATIFCADYNGGVLGVRQSHYRKFDIAVGPAAICITYVEPRRRRRMYFYETPSEAVPAFVMAVAGNVSLEFPLSGINPSGLSYRPQEWPVVHEYYRGISELIASKCDVLFDWRTIPELADCVSGSPLAIGSVLDPCENRRNV